MSVLCLHILQAAMVYVNTLMLQDVLAEDEWSQLLTSEDYRGLTPLTWAHVGMHGEFKLNMNSRLDLGHTSPQADRRACGRVLVRRCGRPRAVTARSRS
jgi:Tn3 transposase DDE domain